MNTYYTRFCPPKPNAVTKVSQVAWQDAGELGALLHKSALLEELTVLVRDWLPADVAPYCRVIGWCGGKCVVGVEYSALAFNLRFQALDLLSALRQHRKFQGLTGVEIRVLADNGERVAKVVESRLPKVKTTLSDASKKLLTDAAKALGDSPIGQALARITQG